METINVSDLMTFRDVEIEVYGELQKQGSFGASVEVSGHGRECAIFQNFEDAPDDDPDGMCWQVHLRLEDDPDSVEKCPGWFNKSGAVATGLSWVCDGRGMRR